MLIALFAPMIDQSEGGADPYSVEVVRKALTLRSGGRIIIQSWNQKHLGRMGDGVSVALLKIFDERELTDPGTIRDFLPIIRDAFNQPRFISVESDKKPSITLLLLDYLRQKVVDTQTQLGIEQTIEFVKEKTKTEHRETGSP